MSASQTTRHAHAYTHLSIITPGESLQSKNGRLDSGCLSHSKERDSSHRKSKGTTLALDLTKC